MKFSTIVIALLVMIVIFTVPGSADISSSGALKSDNFACVTTLYLTSGEKQICQNATETGNQTIICERDTTANGYTSSLFATNGNSEYQSDLSTGEGLTTTRSMTFTSNDGGNAHLSESAMYNLITVPTGPGEPCPPCVVVDGAARNSLAYATSAFTVSNGRIITAVSNDPARLSYDVAASGNGIGYAKFGTLDEIGEFSDLKPVLTGAEQFNAEYLTMGNFEMNVAFQFTP
jgi:hypothetical protein